MSRYKAHRTQLYNRKSSLPRKRRIKIYYCPKCVDEQKSCPYYFKPGTCPEHPKTKLIYDKEFSERLTEKASL